MQRFSAERRSRSAAFGQYGLHDEQGADVYKRQELEREGMNINKLWLRRQTTKFNGVPYVVQRGAAAVFTESGMAEIQHNLDYYRKNAKVIADALDECGVWYCGGKNSPYIWL